MAVLEIPLGRAEIEQILPHREPFLLLDEVLELEPGRRVVARREVPPTTRGSQVISPGGP